MVEEGKVESPRALYHFRLGSSTKASKRNSENSPMALLTKNGMPAPLTGKLPSHGTCMHAVFTAKHLRRGELWWTVTCLDCYMQLLLLRMTEWHTRAIHGWNYDTWFRGRFLEEWAHPQALKELRGAFAHYDGDDVKHALLVTMNLFRWIAAETAEKLGYSYPTKVDEHVTKWVRTCLSQNRSVKL